jgi:hypothetical protein
MNERLDRHNKWSITLLGVFGSVIALLVGIGQLLP